MAAQAGTPPMAYQGRPYAPMIWPAGGPPVKRIDIPAQIIFMLLFVVGAVVHMKIFKGNRSRGHKFLPNLFILFFCMSRILTCILRTASVSLPRNVRLAIAAQIFLAAGVLILFIINIVFAIRLVRSTHRDFGWHPAFGIAFKLLFIVVGATLVMVITGTVQSFYTLNPEIRATDRSLQLYGSTLLAVVATLPLFMVALTLLIPYSPLDEFGTGRLRTKVITLVVSATLLSIGAWYRCGIAWQPPVPRSQPLPGYLGKAPFYILNFLIEFQTVIMYAVLRVDQRWHIPNGAKGPGSYSRSQHLADVEMQDSRPPSANTSATKTSTSIHEDSKNDSKSELDIDMDIEKAMPLPTIPHPATRSRPTSSRPQSLLQQILTKAPTSAQKRQWRASEESRIVRRLGGPWSQLPSPTDSTFSADVDDETRSMVSAETGISAGTGLSMRAAAAPSLRDTLRGEDRDWTPEIEWELASPRRFLSLKKRSLSLLR
ncbi:hypothetical protein CC86DRAFT_453938 [Ophiobolus disseminans]|uniref:DUF3112 domain-containing protein n=1 Tax=Ophiobolus disseminans TaxID=1469910 RepID=A0A6A7A9A2_9PLEO|nr:hypothetical protein CC86DRAFT_453938 [Ophiobolus disseminans]